MHKRFVALDTETTGFTNDDRIIDIFAVEVDPRTGRIGKSFRSRCNPQRASHPKAFEKHRISEADLHHAPLFAHCARQLLDFLAGCCVIAHNVKFDARMLRNEFARIDSSLVMNAHIEFSCSMLAAQEILKKHHWPSLNLLCDEFAIDRSEREEKHAAQLDVELLVQVLPKLHDAYQHQFTNCNTKAEGIPRIGLHSDSIFGFPSP